MIRFFSKLFLFLFILVSIKWLLIYILDSFHLLPDSLTEKIRSLEGLKAPINTIFIGSSRTYTSLNPAYFDSLTQQTHAVNLGVSNLFMPYTADLCEEALMRPGSGIRYILLELSLPRMPLDPFQGKLLKDAHFYWQYERIALSHWSAKTDNVLNVYLNDQVYYLLSPLRDFLLDKLFSLKETLPVMVGEALRPILPTDKLHLLPEATPPPPEKVNGYLGSTQKLTEKSALLSATHTRGLEIYQDKPLPIDFAYSFYYKKLDALQRLATQKEIKLFFYLPNPLNEEEARVLPPFFLQLAPRHRLTIPYDARFDQLFEPRFSRDAVHLNDNGGRVYTGLIAEAFCKQVDQLP